MATSEPLEEVVPDPKSVSDQILYQDFETSKKLLSERAFQNYVFLTKQSVIDKVNQLSDEFGPSVVIPDEEHDEEKMRHKWLGKGKPSEIIKMTEDSKTLNLIDNNQSEKVVENLKEIYKRNIVRIESQDSEEANNNCLLDSIVYQLPNKEYFVSANGETYCGQNLRLQTFDYSATNPKQCHDLVKDHITVTFKEYLLNMLQEVETDHAFYILTRETLGVSLIKLLLTDKSTDRLKLRVF